MRRFIVTVFLIGFFSGSLLATHIVGGEITYKCLGNNEYEITLTIYRDCYNGQPWFDDPAHLAVYNGSWNLVSNLSLPLDENLNDTIPVILTNPCQEVPPDVCVHRTSYKKVITLPPSPGGYTLVYQRCCRNVLIRNLPDPLNTGITVVAEIEEAALLACNNGAVFNNWPPVAICVHEPINFDHSASDPDGDSLVYRLCTPLLGPDSTNNTPNPPPPGPYPEIEWLDPPYNLSNVLGGMPLSIDPATGFMNGVPNTIGNFVVGVCVDEYRNGAVISTTRRDFQYNVADCGVPRAAIAAPQVVCDTLSVKLFNLSTGALYFRWFFDWDNDPLQTSLQYAPIHTYPDTGIYTIALVAEPGDPCSDTAFHVIRLSNTYIQAGFDLSLPDCDSTGLTVQAIDLSQDTVSGLGSWNWLLTGPDGPATAGQSTEQNPVFAATVGGNYTLRLIAAGNNGCPDTSFAQFYAPIPATASLPDSIYFCEHDTVPLWPGANPDYTYHWSPAAYLNDTLAPNPLAFPPGDGTWFVTVSTDLCDRTGAVNLVLDYPDGLEVSADPDRIYLGESSQLLAYMPGAGSYLWTPPESLSDPTVANPLASPDVTTTYTVTAFLPAGCFATASVTVEVLFPECGEPFIFFPTGFSPNGDGQNDVLQLEGRFAEEVYWAVYNRWGEKLFEAGQLEDAWDGTFKGRPMPADTYGYYLRVRCQNEQVYERKGNVTLLR